MASIENNKSDITESEKVISKSKSYYNPFNLPEMSSPDHFNRQKYFKALKKKYEQITVFGRFRITDVEKDFKELYNPIMDLSRRCLTTERAFQDRNYVFIISMIQLITHESLMICQKIQQFNISDKDNILSHQAYIMSKNRGLLQALLDNLKNPITLEQFLRNTQDAINKKKAELIQQEKISKEQLTNKEVTNDPNTISVSESSEQSS